MPLIPDPSEQEWPQISLVTPCYNAERFIEETLTSVLNQGYPNLEYFVLDGGSTDSTLDIIRDHEEQLAGWTSEPDGGMYDALQKGFEKTSGAIMGWINADDILHRQSLFTVGSIFAALPEIKWVQGRPTRIDGLGRVTEVDSRLRRWSNYDYYLGNYRWIQQESTFWTRDLWEQSGGFVDTDLQYAGDLELWARFFRHADLHVSEALIGAFRQHSDGQLSSEHMSEYIQEAEQVIFRERQRLSVPQRKVIRNLKRINLLCDWLDRLRFLDSDGARRRLKRLYVDLPKVVTIKGTPSFLPK